MMISQSLKKTNYRWVILGTVTMVQFISSMVVSSFGPLAPFLIDGLNITRAQLGIFNSLIFTASAIFGIPAGWLIDRFGVRLPLLIGPGVLGLFFALFSLTPNLSIGYFVIFLLGIGFTLVNPTSTIALVHWFPIKRRATAIGIKQSGTTVGSAFGAVIITGLCVWFGWRNTVAVIGAVAVLVIILSFSLYREWPDKSSEPQTIALKAIGRLIVNKNLIYLGVTGAIFIALQTCVATYLVLQLVEVKNMSAVEAGTFLMAANIGGTAGRITWGYISDRVFNGQRKRALTIISITSGTLAIILSIVMASIPLWLLYITIIVFGANAFGWNGLYLTLSTEISGKGTAATGMGWVTTISAIGSIVGPPLFGYVVDSSSSYTPAWLILGVVTLASALLMVLIKENRMVVEKVGFGV